MSKYHVVFRCPACNVNVDEVELEEENFLEYKRHHSKTSKHHTGDSDSRNFVVDAGVCSVCSDE